MSERVQLATGSGVQRPSMRFGNCPVCKMVAVGDECTTCLKNEHKRLQADIKRLAEQALIVLQLDFGYSPGLPCRYGHHPMRHEALWRNARQVLGGTLPDVEAMRKWEAEHPEACARTEKDRSEILDTLEPEEKRDNGPDA